MFALRLTQRCWWIEGLQVYTLRLSGTPGCQRGKESFTQELRGKLRVDRIGLGLIEIRRDVRR